MHQKKGDERMKGADEKQLDAINIEIEAIATATPIGLMLKKMAKESVSLPEKAELLCMLEEVACFRRQVCEYCKAEGHKHADCPVFFRIWNKCRGDRAVNKIRSVVSAE